MLTIWVVTVKDLRQRLRDRSAIMLAVVLPLALAFIYQSIFGSAATPRPFRYAVVDFDRGPVAAAFTDELLADIAAEGVIVVRAVGTREEASVLVSKGTVDAAFILQAGFAQAEGIEVLGGADSAVGTEVATAIARSFTNEIDSIHLAVAAVGTSTSTPQELARRAMATARPLLIEDVAAREKILATKAYFAAGMAVFFLFFAVQYGVLSILDERRLGTLKRLLAAPVSPRAVLAGKLATSVLLGLISMAVLVVATSVLMGVAWGHPIAVGLLVTCGVLAATGVTALVASLARTPEQAGSWQSVIAVALGLLGGAFFPVSQLGEVMAGLSLVTPHAWFLRGLAELSDGGSVKDVLPAAGSMLVFAAITFGSAMLRLGKVVRS